MKKEKAYWRVEVDVQRDGPILASQVADILNPVIREIMDYVETIADDLADAQRLIRALDRDLDAERRLRLSGNIKRRVKRQTQ